MADGYYGAALAYLESQLGGPVEEIEDDATTGATPASIIGNDPEAVLTAVVNLGANPVYLALDSRVSTTRGFYLASNGGTVVFKVIEDGTLSTRELWAVSPVGASSLYLLRVRRRALKG